MQEYTSPASVNRIIGSPMGYVDSKQELPFDTLRSNPRRVVLLDELEKVINQLNDYLCLPLMKVN